MASKHTVLALIPARGGSKGVPRKNILTIAGLPLIAWTIRAAKASGVCGHIVVSTDDTEIADIARREGAEVPFLRPARIARDDTPDYPVFAHAVEWFAKHEGVAPKIVLWLRPTSPLRTATHIKEALRLLTSTKADAVRSVCAVEQHPSWMKTIDGKKQLHPLIPGHDERSFPRRQTLKPVYLLSGLVDVVRVSSALKNGALFAGDVRGYVADPAVSRELDAPGDIPVLERALQESGVDPSGLSIDPLQPANAAELSALILGDSKTYRQHFTPFPFGKASLSKHLSRARKDCYWGIRVGGKLACLFMLRGFDDGYERPSFGVYVGERFAGLGLASLALQYALSWCRARGVRSVMLKVHPENAAASHVYQRAGFVFEEVCDRTGHHVFTKVFRS